MSKLTFPCQQVLVAVDTLSSLGSKLLLLCSSASSSASSLVFVALAEGSSKISMAEALKGSGWNVIHQLSFLDSKHRVRNVTLGVFVRRALASPCSAVYAAAGSCSAQQPCQQACHKCSTAHLVLASSASLRDRSISESGKSTKHCTTIALI